MTPETMKWIFLLVLVAVAVAVYLLKQTGEISARDAVECLKNGALVIDVRSTGEYNTEHLPNTVNIPLDVLQDAMPQRVANKSQVLLVHCQSGMRSAIAMRRLKEMGYANVFNLGSLSRARAILARAESS